jgi:hypothetical protein
MAGSSVMFCRDALQASLRHAMLLAVASNDLQVLESVGSASLDMVRETTCVTRHQTRGERDHRGDVIPEVVLLPGVGVAKQDDGNTGLSRQTIEEDALSSQSSGWASGYEELATTRARSAEPSPLTDNDGQPVHDSAKTNALPADVPAAQDFGAPIRDRVFGYHNSHPAGPD